MTIINVVANEVQKNAVNWTMGNVFFSSPEPKAQDELL